MNTLRTLRQTLVPTTAIAVVILAGFAGPASADAGMANPAISIQASPSGFPAGSLIFGSAMLGLGNAPTGNIVFTLYAPADMTCTGAPLTVSYVPVNGNGYYASANFATNAAGIYRWTAKYLGDANNNPTPTTACGDAGSVVILGKRTLNLRTQAASSSGMISNTGSLAYGSGPSGPTGTLTFSLYGAGNMTCAGAPVFTSVKPVAGNGSYASDSFAAPGPGTYQWIVRYSGDANNNGAATWCADPANAVTVTATAAATATVTATPSAVRAYEQLTVTWTIPTPTAGDWFALYAQGASDGTVLTWRYTGGSANGSTSVLVPWGTRAGSYEIRLFANNSAQRLDVSEVITVY